MNSSQNSNRNILLSVYQDKRTVFLLIDIAQLSSETNFQSLNRKLNYYVRTGRLLNPRKGIYIKQDYNPEELVCSVFTPSYISLEYVLQRSGIIYQYDPDITAVSYLSRKIEIDGRYFQFHRIKGEILVNTAGITKRNDHVSIASAERAFLDLMYLYKEYYFDDLNPLNKKTIAELLPVYRSRALSERVNKILKNG